MSSIVVYFSHTGENYSEDGIKDLKEGHVDILAHIIADELNAPLFRLVPLVRYPHDYQSTVRRAKEEYDSGARPAFDETNMPDFAQYSDIYLFEFCNIIRNNIILQFSRNIIRITADNTSHFKIRSCL